MITLLARLITTHLLSVIMMMIAKTVTKMTLIRVLKLALCWHELSIHVFLVYAVFDADARDWKEFKRSAAELADEINQPNFVSLIQEFLHDQLSSADITFHQNTSLSIYGAAVAKFYAPSDPSGLHSMRHECIHAQPSWRQEGPRYDCAFISIDPDLPGMRGLAVVHVQLLFSFEYREKVYPCTLVKWFTHVGNGPDEDTGMWQAELGEEPKVSIIHLDCMIHAAHLIPVFGANFIPTGVKLSNSLDIFCSYYINKYIDHHAFEIAF
jgi:hypothetical protein